MIRLELADEPDSFESEVRQPGLRAINELSGAPSDRTAGKKFAKIANAKEEIPASEFPPYWRKATQDLYDAYSGICAFLCLCIPKGTGASSVDHMIPKSENWSLVYEWSNYRLACSRMNSRKREHEDVLDPFKIEDGWFELNLFNFRVIPANGLPSDILEAVEKTISRLKLCDQKCCDARADYAKLYWNGEYSFEYLSRYAPFVAKEIQRQNSLRSDDQN